MVTKRKKASGVFVMMPLMAFFFLLLPALLEAGEVTLAWDPNSESNLAGYKLYYDGDSDSEMYGGTGANEGDSPVVIYLEDLADASSPTFTLTDLEDGQYYYFALTAFDTDGLESDFSDEVGTLIGFETSSDKAVADSSDISSSETSDSSSSGSDGSSSSGGGKCFITGIADGHDAPSRPAMMAVFLLLAAAIALQTGRNMKKAQKISPRREKEQPRP